MGATVSWLMHGTPGLVLAYLLALASIWVGLIRAGAQMSRHGRSLIDAVGVVLAAGLGQMILGALGAATGGFVRGSVGIGLLMLLGCWRGKVLARGPESPGGYRRGAVVVDGLLRRLSGGKDPRLGTRDKTEVITIAGVPVPAADETKHFKLVGTTGTGKSTAIREMLRAALARGDRAVIADPDGGYLERFFDADRGDVILNPFEGRSVQWSLLGEIVSQHDVDQMARSLIPDGGASDKCWCEYARTFFTAVVQQLIVAGVRDDAEIYRLICTAPVAELRLLLASTVAGPFLDEHNEKMFGSIRSVTVSAVRALRYTTQQQTPPFSVREWIGRDAGRGGVLFMPYRAGEIAALRSAISAWMRIAIFAAMDRPEGDQHLWFVVDELDALGEIDGLKDALARLRKFGGRCVLGLQSISQVSSTYGHGVADTIVENCGNALILRCSAGEKGGTSQFASRLIGQREVVHLTRSKTRHPSQWWASTTTTEHLSIEPAVMASEIERLPDLEGFLKLASTPDWMQVRLDPVSYDTGIAEGARA
jgi:type IV secretory pathway TraG/TraD family ATPase VirD4